LPLLREARVSLQVTLGQSCRCSLEFLILERPGPGLAIVDIVGPAQRCVERLAKLRLDEFLLAGFKLALELKIPARERSLLGDVLQAVELILHFHVVEFRWVVIHGIDFGLAVDRPNVSEIIIRQFDRDELRCFR
jgi:hypothetical protein